MKLVESVRTDNKVEMRRVALEAARTYEREASDRIRRMNIVGAELELRGGGRRGGPAGLDARLSALTDAWYDEARKQGGSAGAVLGQSQEV